MQLQIKFWSFLSKLLWRRMLENLEKDAATQKYLYLQSTAGTKFSRRKKYREPEAKVQNAIEHHQDENIVAFLRAMASLSMSNWTLWILRVLCLNFQKIQFSRKLQGFSQRKYNTVIRTKSGFFLFPPHPISIIQVPEIGNLGKPGFRKSWKFMC